MCSTNKICFSIKRKTEIAGNTDMTKTSYVLHILLPYSSLK